MATFFCTLEVGESRVKKMSPGRHLGVSSLYHKYLVGGFNHLEKYESQWEGLSHI
jgi:hypothetical protein